MPFSEVDYESDPDFIIVMTPKWTFSLRIHTMINVGRWSIKIRSAWGGVNTDHHVVDELPD